MRDEIDRFVDVPDGFLYCQTHGEGQDVVLVNAGAADLRMWESTISWLSQVARVTTFDYRDTGLSSPGSKPYSEIEDIAAVMDAGGVLSAVLVGVSDGVWARRIVSQAPIASLTMIPEADHFPMLSAPQQFKRFLRETLG